MLFLGYKKDGAMKAIWKGNVAPGLGDENDLTIVADYVTNPGMILQAIPIFLK